MKKLKAALILDNLSLSEWQKNALEEAYDSLDIKIIINCQNTRIKKNIRKNFLYYALNFFTLKNSLTKLTRYNITNEKVVNFDSIYKGSWQSIPNAISQQLIDEGIEVVIKYGMSLLRIDDYLKALPILSFHHGNPSKYRGRPAGFYELLYNEDNLGLIVQRLTNKLDGGEVLAFAESKLVYHSYKKTAENFYEQSRFLLSKALINLKNNKAIAIDAKGKNYRLPSNFLVAYFFLLLLQRRLKYLIYGAFYEKKWKVGTTIFRPDLTASNTINGNDITELSIEPKYSFYADPFFSIDSNKIRLEALDKNSGLGDIIEIDQKDNYKSTLLLTGCHFSYPFSFVLNKKEYLLPEVASHSAQYYYDLMDDSDKRNSLKGLEGKRIVDATLIEHEQNWYLFFGENDTAHSILNLWVSDSIDGEFKKHPDSPVCMSPASARMAGRILSTNEGVFRFGQNNNRGYGSSIVISKIIKMSPKVYEERVCGSININDRLGPHSIDFSKKEGKILIDCYTDEFSLSAGVRRIKALLSKR